MALNASSMLLMSPVFVPGLLILAMHGVPDIPSSCFLPSILPIPLRGPVIHLLAKRQPGFFSPSFQGSAPGYAWSAFTSARNQSSTLYVATVAFFLD